MPATLPWPKIANTPSNRRCFFPSISTRWALRKRTIAWAAVNRIVVMALPRFDQCLFGRRRFDLRLARHPHTLPPEIAQTRKRGGHAVDRLAIVDTASEPLDRRLGKDRPADREALNDAAIVRQLEGLRPILFRRPTPNQQHAAA